MDKQNIPNDPRNKRMSFKQFQQHYEQQTIISKQKRKSQQQQLQKMAANNIRPLQNNSKEPVNIIALNKHNESSAVSQSKKSTQSLSLTQLNSLNSSAGFPSNFVSPKASTNALIKSINLASNKSRQFAKSNLNSLSKEKLINAKLNIVPKHNTVINLNCGNQKNYVNKNLTLKKDSSQFQKNMKKISSISKMTTTDVGESSLLSFPSQKILQFTANDHNDPIFEQEKPSKSLQQTLQYVNYLVSEVNFLNQVFKELQNQQNGENHQQKLSQLSYKSKLLAQIRAKLDKQSGMFGVNIKNQQNPIKSLHEAVLTLLNNYESDIKHESPKQQNSKEIKSHKIPLSIKINDQPQAKFDLQINQKRQQSKKKTIKLSKSRRTHEQTINSQSKVRPYLETSQFSILNTSKITQLSRPSSQNKNLPYMNEIQHVIHSKILDNFEDENNLNEQQRPKYDLGNIKNVNLSDGAKSMGKHDWIRQQSSQIKKEGLKEMEKSSKIVLKGQSCEDGKKKVVSKTIHLISNSTSNDRSYNQAGNKQYPSVPKCTKILTKPIKENKNSMNLAVQTSQTSMKVKSISIGSQKGLATNSQDQNSPAPSHSHNQSIYELQFLQNYPGFNPPSNYSSIEPKYTQQLFR